MKWRWMFSKAGCNSDGCCECREEWCTVSLRAMVVAVIRGREKGIRTG